MKRNYIILISIGVLAICCLFYLSHYGKPMNKVARIIDPSDELLQVRHNTERLDNVENDSDFKGLPMEKADINLYFEGKELKLSLPLYVENNRYYLPLKQIIYYLGGQAYTEEDKVYISLNERFLFINIKSNTFTCNNMIMNLRRPLITSDKFIYLSMFDFCKLFNLKARWDFEKNTISLYRRRENVVQKQVPSTGRPALIRLEDIGPGGRYSSPDDMEKLRIIADYLYSENVPFHVAYVSRFVDPRPKYQIDNDPSKQYSINNADFIFTIDYFIDRNGMIGLHGYTHQYGNTVSMDGIEFHRNSRDNIPASEQYADERINMAIASAQKLSIPFGFFEAPHYAIYPKQLKVMEGKFDYIYEPYSPDGYTEINSTVVVRKNENRITRFIPTPLGYVDGKGDLNNMLLRINNLRQDYMASIFYHPNIEFEYIKPDDDSDGYPGYTYSEDSVLHKIIQAIGKKGWRFVLINQL